ncbi:hypothetical protein N9L26_01595 [Candidatus Pacebacteria bacterium]|nr:hypothetical protein [Candidatus Paceibacterota bacterium]
MARKKLTRQKRSRYRFAFLIILFFFIVSAVSVLSVYQHVWADNEDLAVILDIDPNIGLQQEVEAFFMANNAPEMIPIIKCESNFKHFDRDGEVLMNSAGSSATGITQIIASLHPDPKALQVYNRRHNTILTPADFDITTVAGNLAYALLLYEVRGVRDWECAKKFTFL